MPKRRAKGIVFENLEMGIAFGKHFKEIRLEQGYSQEKLALEAGVERSTIARIEAAKMNVTVDLIFTLSLALKVAPANLFEFEITEHKVHKPGVHPFVPPAFMKGKIITK